LTTSSTWADGFHAVDSGTAELSGLHCGGPALPAFAVAPPASPTILQSIAGHIYLCNNTVPSATEVPGGTLATTGPQTLGSSPNHFLHRGRSGRLCRDGDPPPDYVLVGCGGTSAPVSGATTATEAVAVPAGGSGVGIFYVTNSAPALTLLKSATESSYDAAGQSIDYDYLLTNTGNVTLSAVGVLDAHAGLSGLSCPDSTLARRPPRPARPPTW